MNTLKKHTLDTTQRERIHNGWMAKVHDHVLTNFATSINSICVEGDRTIVVDYQNDEHRRTAYCWINCEGRVVVDTIADIV